MSLPPNKKPKKLRSKKINIGVRQRWEAILKTIAKDEVPVELLESMTVNLDDGTKVNIDIKELLSDGADPKAIEQHINEKLEALDAVIVDVDFFICVDSVVQTIQPATDEILKDLK